MLELVTGENSAVLRTVCDPVTVFDDALKKQVEQMTTLMLAPQAGDVTGVGLAANQVNFTNRVLITTFNISTRKSPKVVVMINPEVLEISDQEVWMEEGCLSLPEIFAEVKRPAKVKVRWQSVNGDWAEKKLAGWDARIFLHELDHLDGKLFTDYPLRGERKPFRSGAIPR